MRSRKRKKPLPKTKQRRKMADKKGYTDLSARTKLRLKGEDRVSYLNGQVTNDVKRATETEALYACVTTAKGKIQADVHITADDESFLIDGPAELRETLFARLEQYIISEDAELSDVTDDYALIHVLGLQPESENALIRSSSRYGCPGLDYWLPKGEEAELLEKMDALGEATLEAFRISGGVAVWGAELSEEVMLAEARLQLRAVDFHKGCYIGQEVISRIQSAGKVNRQLCLLVGDKALAAPPEAGMLLFDTLETGDPVEVGKLTSVGFDADMERHVALGYVKRNYTEAGRELFGGKDEKNLSTPLEIRKTS